MWYRQIIASKKDALRILDNDLEAFKIITEQITTTPKYQPIAAYFLKIGASAHDLKPVIDQLDEILKKRPSETQVTSKGLKWGKQFFTDWLKFSEEVHTEHGLLYPKDIPDVSNIKPPIKTKPGEIIVEKADNVHDTIRLGSGTTWCISQPGNTMWQSYRDMQASTFYVVFDGNQPTTPDPSKGVNDPYYLSRVAVDMTKNGVKLTDLRNTTGTIAIFGSDYQKYFDYLQSKGVDISQFKNKPITPEEQEEAKLIGRVNSDLQWFKNLSFEHKSKYIGRGHLLTDEQFDYLNDRNTSKLINQYVNTGRPLSKYQKSKLKDGDMKSYDRARNIAADTYITQYGSVDEAMEVAIENDPELAMRLVKYKGGTLTPDLEYTAMSSAFNEGDKDMIEFLLEQGATITYELADDVMYDAVYQHDKDMIEFLLKKGTTLNYNLVNRGMWVAIRNCDKDMIEFFLGKGATLTLEQVNEGISSAVHRRKEDMIGFFLEKGADPNKGMWSAVYSHDTNLTKFFLTKGATLTLESATRIMSDAVSRRDESMIELLLEIGVNPNQGMYDAIDNRNKDMIEFFLKKGATITPELASRGMYDAVHNGDTDMITFLLGKGVDPVRTLKQFTFAPQYIQELIQSYIPNK